MAKELYWSSATKWKEQRGTRCMLTGARIDRQPLAARGDAQQSGNWVIESLPQFSSVLTNSEGESVVALPAAKIDLPARAE
jgi:hypothetical protein